MLYILTILLFMCDTVRRMMSGIRAVDWVMMVMEFLVLVLIAYEVGMPILERRKQRKYRAAITSLMTEGQGLCESVPDNRGTDPHDWIVTVDSWIDKTRGQLQNYSPNAVAAFNQEYWVEIQAPISIADGARPHYYKLAGKLKNLHDIAEKLEVYS
jgi:hypothetical protein